MDKQNTESTRDEKSDTRMEGRVGKVEEGRQERCRVVVVLTSTNNDIMHNDPYDDNLLYMRKPCI